MIKLSSFGSAVFIIPFIYASTLLASIPPDSGSEKYRLIPKTSEYLLHIDRRHDASSEFVYWASLDTAVESDAGRSLSENTADESAASDDFDDDFDLEDEFAESSASSVFDPLSGYNRLMTKFNDKVYFWVLKPVAKGYRAVVPETARRSIVRFFNNLLFPVRFVNNTLQLKFKQAGVELTRFIVNSTVGLLGFADPAKNWFELEAYPEDFGQTLGHYGLGGGFHIVLPFLGPSNLRDMVGLVPDYFLDPVSYVEDPETEIGVKSYNKVNNTSLHIGEYESLKSDAVDLYLFLRDAYEQNRKKKIEE